MNATTAPAKPTNTDPVEIHAGRRARDVRARERDQERTREGREQAEPGAGDHPRSSVSGVDVERHARAA